HLVRMNFSIIMLLTIVYFSYRQTIAAYPGGGGSYTVARLNLGINAGLLAAAALMIDYILVVAVGISAGVGALVSAVPSLQPHTLSLCMAILAVVTLVNLRGVRETGIIFLAPTYLFVGTILIAIVVGLIRHGGRGGASRAGGRAAIAAEGSGGGKPMAAAEGFCQRLHGNDGGGSGLERCEGVSRADRAECQALADRDYRVAHRDASRNRLPGA